jgi:putative membrane-bound dehydrogenase-like protein
MSRISWLLFAVLLSCCFLATAAEVTLNGHKFTLPEGFEIELIAGSPLVNRPITADFDEQGRLYVGDSSGSNDPTPKQLEEKPHRIVRLEDKDGDGVFDTSTVFADRMMFPEGTLWYDGSLYVAAPPSIWKLTDTNGDGVADQRSEWFQGKTLTGCANDLHGPYLGLDGWIYWNKGAFAEQSYTINGKPWKSKASHIFRCRPDGSGIEPVMTGGMDNPVDTVFMPNGERIFTTTFFQHPTFGQRDGLIHAIYGGVYGKPHPVLDSHPRTGDLMPVLSHTGASAPCGLTRYDSDLFGQEYRDNLFAAQFNMQKITRHVLTPSGASYTSQDSDFLVSDNRDFHPTDVLADADGTLVVVDTGGWYKLCCPTSQLWKPDVLGAIYRVRPSGVLRVSAPRPKTIGWKSSSLHSLLQAMDSAKPAVRERAVEEFSRRRHSNEMKKLLAQFLDWERNRPAVSLVDLFRDETNRATLELAKKLDEGNTACVWALIRIDIPESRTLLRRMLQHGTEVARQAALHGISLHRDAEAFPQLVEVLNTGTAMNRRAAAEALGRIGNRSAVPHLLAAAAKAENRALEHSIIYALIELADPQATAQGLAAADPRIQRAALVALDQMEGGNLKPEIVAPLLSSNAPLVQQTADWIVLHRPEWGNALAGWCREQLAQTNGAEEAAAPLEAKLVQFSTTPAIQQLLAATAADLQSPMPTRRLALRVMAQAKPKELPSGWADALAQAVVGEDETVLSAAVAAARAIPPQKTIAKQLNDALIQVASRDLASTQTRLDALAAVAGGLPQVPDGQFELLLASLAVEHPLAMRSAAADALSQARLTPAQLERLTQAVRTAGPLELERLLGPFEKSTDEGLAFKLLAALREAPALAALRIDVLRQRLAKYSPKVQQGIDELQALVDVDAAAQRARIDELLPSVSSGDVRRGQAVFNSAKAACTACHKFGYLGGLSGPDLTKIGRIRNERDLLEAILYPSLSFVRSYEPVILVTTDGRALNGLVRGETATEIILATGPNQEVRLRKDEIEEQQNSKISIMPAGLDKQLTLQELLDLVAFLKNAK